MTKASRQRRYQELRALGLWLDAYCKMIYVGAMTTRDGP